MNLVADENIEVAIVERLRADGHSVLSIAESCPRATDSEVLQQANDRGAIFAILVTSDRDFGELVFRLRKVSFGVILLRLTT